MDAAQCLATLKALAGAEVAAPQEGAVALASPGRQQAAEAAEAAEAAAEEEEVGRAAQPPLRRGGEPKQPSTPGTPASAFEYTGDFTGGLSALTNPGPDPDPDL